MSGLDKTRVVGPPQDYLDEFTCGICREVLIDPKETKCCQQMYCNQCISEWLSNNQSCPNDRKRMSNKDLKSPSRIVKNLLNGLKVKCEYHYRGCDFIGKYDNIGRHVMFCVKNPDRICEICGTSNPSISGHDCVSGLLIRNGQLSDQIKALTFELEKLKGKLVNPKIRLVIVFT